MTTYKPLSELVPPEYLPAVQDWLATQIRLTADARDVAAEVTMPQLGISGEVIAAHRQATAELRALADRWVSERPKGGDTR